MKSVLVLYHSNSGHTARIARRIWETVIAEGNQADLMCVMEADREGLDWNKYDLVIVGAPVFYGKFSRQLVAFVNRYKSVLDAKATSFFSVSVVLLVSAVFFSVTKLAACMASIRILSSGTLKLRSHTKYPFSWPINRSIIS